MSRVWMVSYHYDVIKWKYFPHYWPFVRGIHRPPVNSPHKGQWPWTSLFSLIGALNKRLSKQPWGWWFETPSRSLWRHCNDTSPHIMHWSLFKVDLVLLAALTPLWFNSSYRKILAKSMWMKNNWKQQTLYNSYSYRHELNYAFGVH